MPIQKKSLAWPIILTFLIILGWMPFEGILRLVITVGIVLTILWVWVFHQRYKNQLLQRFSGAPAFVGYWAITGGIAGLLAPAVILGLMVLKTGVHSHGPEFRQIEILWVLGRFYQWGGLGLLIGLAIGLLVSAFKEA